ncbi:MAG: KTSC domain-containing protein [Verrucomicrobia bacterium]|nr:KTSC domain-containing protein [Verrucomicrobiota bacterium]
MRATAVESTTLTTVSYDDAKGLLQLEFCSRAVYQYFSVPAVVHQSLLDASSKGRYFNQAIRGRFPYRLILDPAAARRRAEISARCDR